MRPKSSSYWTILEEGISLLGSSTYVDKGRIIRGGFVLQEVARYGSVIDIRGSIGQSSQSTKYSSSCGELHNEVVDGYKRKIGCNSEFKLTVKLQVFAELASKLSMMGNATSITRALTKGSVFIFLCLRLPPLSIARSEFQLTL